VDKLIDNLPEALLGGEFNPEVLLKLGAIAFEKFVDGLFVVEGLLINDVVPAEARIDAVGQVEVQFVLVHFSVLRLHLLD
jgi:hypothetical protein